MDIRIAKDSLKQIVRKGTKADLDHLDDLDPNMVSNIGREKVQPAYAEGITIEKQAVNEDILIVARVESGEVSQTEASKEKVQAHEFVKDYDRMVTAVRNGIDESYTTAEMERVKPSDKDARPETYGRGPARVALEKGFTEGCKKEITVPNEVRFKESTDTEGHLYRSSRYPLEVRMGDSRTYIYERATGPRTVDDFDHLDGESDWELLYDRETEQPFVYHDCGQDDPDSPLFIYTRGRVMDHSGSAGSILRSSKGRGAPVEYIRCGHCSSPMPTHLRKLASILHM